MLSVISEVITCLDILDSKINLEAICQAHIVHCRLGLEIDELLKVSQTWDKTYNPSKALSQTVNIVQFSLFSPWHPRLLLIPMRY